MSVFSSFTKVAGVAVASLALFAAAPSQAALVYVGTFSGNDNVNGNNNGQNNDISDEIFNFNGDLSATFLGRFNVGGNDSDGAVDTSASFMLTNGGTSGSVSFDLTGTGYGLEYVVLKAGAQFALFAWVCDPFHGDFDWDLDGLIVNGQQVTQALSHISFYGDLMDPPQEVPLPAGIWLMGAGLLGLRAANRKKA